MTTSDITVAVPTLNRAEQLSEVMKRFHDVPLLFLPDPADRKTMRKLEHAGANYGIAPIVPEFGRRTYASKINHAYRVTSTPFLLFASDDVVPEPGWVYRALAHLQDERIGLLATNDLRHHLVMRGKLATHGIVRRAYVERYGSASLPGAGPVLHEGYGHWCVDCEISWVARERDAFKFAHDVILRHAAPPDRSTGIDSTYALGRSTKAQDQRLRTARIPTWPGVTTSDLTTSPHADLDAIRADLRTVLDTAEERARNLNERKAIARVRAHLSIPKETHS